MKLFFCLLVIAFVLILIVSNHVSPSLTAIPQVNYDPSALMHVMTLAGLK